MGLLGGKGMYSCNRKIMNYPVFPFFAQMRPKAKIIFNMIFCKN